MKLLLYCTKNKENLWSNNLKYFFLDGAYNRIIDDLPKYLLNGKIVAECEYELEEIKQNVSSVVEQWYPKELLDESCLNAWQLLDYLGDKIGDKGYAIHIKNLHIFGEPKELSEFYKYNYKDETWSPVDKAPQNMMQVDYINIENNIFLPYILISIRPEWLCKILNGEKTIEVRKKVLKEMVR